MRRQSSGTLAVVLFVAVLSTTTASIISVNSPPRIIKQPPTDEILFKVAQPNKEIDKPFVIECEAQGQPDPTYRWVKNGKEFDWQAYDNRMLQVPGRGTLVITSPKDEDMGHYQCFAENELGTATSNSVYFRNSKLNAFKDEAVITVEANEGEPFSLQCEVPDGWPKPIVYWLLQHSIYGNIKSINSSRITLDPDGTLWFSNVTREDASDDFYYACSATSVFRSEYKIGNRVLLDVKQTGISASQNKYAPIRQYVTQKNAVALRGKRVEIFCIFGGTPLPQTVWKKNGGLINWSDRITQGHYGKSLVIRQVNFDDNGTYTCDVSNGVGNAQSYSINLKINAIPYFTVEPEIKNATKGETVEFLCEAAGSPEPTIQWIHNGKPISQAPPNPRRIVETNRIILRDVLKGDNGNYGCNVTNSLGYVYKDVFLNVLALPPEIVDPPRKEATFDGKNVTMRCRVFGAPKPQVKWIRNGLELTGGRYTVLSSGDLKIKQVSSSDAGQYTCYAKNKFGEKTANISLIVKRRTRIIYKPQNTEVVAGQSATFRCTPYHDNTLNLTIEWLKDSQQIDFEAEARFVKTSDNSLTIAKTIELDSGIYTCVARTELDKVSAKAYLIVQDVPNAPLLLGVKCNKGQAEIHWTTNGDSRSPILHYTIQYNTSFTPASWHVAYEMIPPTDLSFTVDMSPWANYTFRVIAYNKIGASPPSGHSEICSTKPDVPFKNPDNVAGQGTKPDNLVITWTSIPEIEHNAPNFQYRVSWKRNDIAGISWANKDIYDWQHTSLVIRDQPTFVPYLIKVVAINELGEAYVAPEEVIGYSGEDRPLEAPTEFSVIQIIDATKAILGWNQVSVDSIRGHFKGYKIQTWTEMEGEEGLREIHIRQDYNQALVTQFKPFTKNFARILAYNERFNGPASSIIDFDTPEGVPGPVESFEVYSMGSSAFWLVWKQPLNPNGKLTGYKIYYEKVLGRYIDNKYEYENVNSSVTRTKMVGLKPNTKYRISIAATTKAGVGTPYFIEKRTLSEDSQIPAVPSFEYSQEPSSNGNQI